MHSNRLTTLTLAALARTLAGCGGGAGSTTGSAGLTSVNPFPLPNGPAPVTQTFRLGDALPGLTAAQQQQFSAGQAQFLHVETPQTGLGPIFNGVSCAACHNQPAPGGGGALVEVRFGRTVSNVFDPLTAEGGSLFHFHANPGITPQVIPADANVRAGRRTTSILGLGLVEAIPDDDIKALASQEASAHPASAGQVNLVVSATDGTLRVGRFGWKCQEATLLDFAGDAYLNEMGVSNPLFPFDILPNQAPVPVAAGHTEDEPGPDGQRDIDRLAVFMRYLAPPPSVTQTAGRHLFEAVGCDQCHHPSFTTKSSIPALDGQTVNAWSDFLLHDVGTGDHIAQGNAPAGKVRTAPLMGISQSPSLLHDGSAATVEQAILAHGNEAADSRAAFQALSPSDQKTLADFVRSL